MYVEKFILELQGGAVTSIDLNETLLINGSDYGTVYIFTLNQRTSKSALVYKCTNIQDNNIPIARVFLSDYSVGGALDVKGNFRVYDLVRFRKFGKYASSVGKQDNGRNLRSSISVASTGSMINAVCF